jgi:hypothetical protein
MNNARFLSETEERVSVLVAGRSLVSFGAVNYVSYPQTEARC